MFFLNTTGAAPPPPPPPTRPAGLSPTHAPTHSPSHLEKKSAEEGGEKDAPVPVKVAPDAGSLRVATPKAKATGERGGCGRVCCTSGVTGRPGAPAKGQPPQPARSGRLGKLPLNPEALVDLIAGRLFLVRVSARQGQNTRGRSLIFSRPASEGQAPSRPRPGRPGREKNGTNRGRRRPGAGAP